MKDKAQLQLRLPEKTYEHIREEAEAMGVSINAHILELIDLGIRAREQFPILQEK